MRPSPLMLLSCALLAAGLSAQGGVAPPLLSTFGKDPLFSVPNVPGTSLSQIHMVPHPALKGQFLVTMTVSGLPAANGGVGNGDFLSGIYDPTAKTFTPDLNAAGLNSSTGEFGLTMFHDGLWAVFESSANSALGYTVYFAERPDVKSPFKIKGNITGIPAQSYWDPSLGLVNGKLHLFHMLSKTSGGGDLAMSELNYATLAIGKTFTIALSTASTAEVNSPTPIFDSTGETVAFSHHLTVNSNDHYWSADLDPATPILQFITTTTWINNGGYAAGTFFDAESSNISSVESAWWTGGVAGIGTPLEISAYAPIRGATAVPWITTILLSTGFLATPLAVPGLTGQFGIDPILILPLALGAHGQADGKATTTLPVPNDAALVGAKVAGQNLTIDPTGPKYILGNTGSLRIR